MNAEQITGVVTDHGEGAGWDPVAGTFRVVDMLVGDVLSLSGDQVTDRLHVGAVAAAWRPRVTGGLVVATERGFARFAADGTLESEVDAWADDQVRMNDGGCDPQGRFYCGSMAYDARPGAGALWRYDLDGSVHQVLDGLTIANGLVWSLDGSRAFHIDTPRGCIDVYEYDADAGALRGRAEFARVEGGGPDGMTIDAEGGLWVALWGGSAVHRYDASGKLSVVVEVGARQVTSCAFGGEDLQTLLITTSRYGLAEEDEPAAGALFAVRPGVAGVLPHLYGV